MEAKNILSLMDLGNSVAEYDKNLESYFLETQPFSLLISQNKDIVSGDKGTGKTAIYKVVISKYRNYAELSDVEVVPAFNPMGSPIFQKLNTKVALSEVEYIKLWKAYIFALLGNWILGIYNEEENTKLGTLHNILVGLDLRTSDDSPRTVFDKIIGKIGSFFFWKKAEVEFSFDLNGKITIQPKVEFGKPEQSVVKEVPIESVLILLNSCLEDLGITAWVALDRLDEAFQGLPEVEIPALRALLRTYLDMNEFNNIKLKLFLRRDLFRRITGSAFVNLSHVNAKKVEVYWNDDDLKNLLIRRIRQNSQIVKTIGLENASDTELFDAVFPEKVDQGLRKPSTWVWMMRRVRDGNDVKPPRNLIDLVSLARDEQIKKDARTSRQWIKGTSLIDGDSLRAALEQLSKNRVQDTLLAESGSYASQIQAFEGGKAEHDEASIAKYLKVEKDEVKTKIKPLLDLGFFEYIRNTGTYKIPALYRSGLEITQGRAFDIGVQGVDEDD